MTNFLLFGSLGLPEIAIIALVIILVFGGKKIPELMKGIGKGVRNFKDGINNIDEPESPSGKAGANSEKGANVEKSASEVKEQKSESTKTEDTK